MDKMFFNAFTGIPNCYLNIVDILLLYKYGMLYSFEREMIF